MEQAKKAIQRIFTDMSVSPSETAARLKELRTLIDDALDALRLVGGGCSTTGSKWPDRQEALPVQVLDAIAAHIRAAAAEERERCAKIAEAGAETCAGYGNSVKAKGRDWRDPHQHSDAHDYCHRSLEIAKKIREG